MRNSCTRSRVARRTRAMGVGQATLGLVLCVLLMPAIGEGGSADASGAVPEGLSASDWAGIRQAYEDHLHAVRPAEGGYVARNPRQQWQTHFDGRGFTARPDAGGWSWGLELQRYGFAGRERTVSGPAQVRAEGGRVVYEWDAVWRSGMSTTGAVSSTAIPSASGSPVAGARRPAARCASPWRCAAGYRPRCPATGTACASCPATDRPL